MTSQPAQLDDRPEAIDSGPGPRRLHVVALLTAAATFPLIFMGGLVTTHRAGMSVPDWPNSYGYNMFLFPPSQWVGGIFYEHTHRLAGTLVGFLSVVLTLVAWGVSARDGVRRRVMIATGAVAALAAGATIAAALLIGHVGGHVGVRVFNAVAQGAVSLWGLDLVLLIACFARRREPRRWVRWLAAAVLASVLLQGLLGGLRVVLVNLNLAILHACVAQAFFCLAVLAAVVTSRKWANAPHLRESGRAGGGRLLVILLSTTTVLVYLQLIAGALMRHYDAGLAIPDLPLAYGKILPPASQEALLAINHHRAFDLKLDPVTLAQVWVHFAHRVGAVLVSLAASASVLSVFLRHRRGGLVGPAAALAILLVVQVTLGVLTVLLGKPADVASAHVATGALVLATSFVLTVRAMRLYRPTLRRAPAPAGTIEQPYSRDRNPGLVTT